MSGLRIRQITPLCQLQDLGRFGYQSQGVTRSGAMDSHLLRLANALVGNPLASACLEFALAGGEFEVLNPSVRVALAGNFGLRVNAEPVEPFCSHRLRRGDVLSIDAPLYGIRAYLAVAGGFRVKPQLGSASTHLRSGLGGFDAPMAVNGQLPLNIDYAPLARERSLRRGLRRRSGEAVRVVMGPQQAAFSEQGISDFLAGKFSVRVDSDRMGIRLEGVKIEHAGDGNIISDPVLPGSVQVPAAGDPIVLMADGPTTGGYPKIATVASIDVATLAQLGAGDTLRFEAISVAEAQQLLLEERRFFAGIEQRLDRY